MGLVSVTNVSDGTTATAAGVNNQINAIVGEFNGNIDNANIKSGAAIDGSKFADGSITPAKLFAATGTDWIPDTFTTVLTNIAIGTLGTPTSSIDYLQIGKYVICRLNIMLGTSGMSVGSNASFTLPVTASTHLPEEALGTVSCYDASGAASYSALVCYKSTTEAYIRPMASSGGGILNGGTTSTTPFTWAANDAIRGYFMYRAA